MVPIAWCEPYPFCCTWLRAYVNMLHVLGLATRNWKRTKYYIEMAVPKIRETRTSKTGDYGMQK